MAQPYLSDPQVAAFLQGKTEHTLTLFRDFYTAFARCGPIALHAAKTMIGIRSGGRTVAWITQLGRSFLHVVFPFPQPYPDNLCFSKIARVPGQQQYNHHLRLLRPEDINEEVCSFMRMALDR